MSIMEAVAGAFTTIVKFIAGTADGFGLQFATLLNSFSAGLIPADALFGSTLIVIILGLVAWKFISSTPIRWLVILILGAVLLTVFSVGSAGSLPGIINTTMNATGA